MFERQRAAAASIIANIDGSIPHAMAPGERPGSD
jgi:hypothetical protein